MSTNEQLKSQVSDAAVAQALFTTAKYRLARLVYNAYISSWGQLLLNYQPLHVNLNL
jgi:hypothetical protein